MLEMVYLTNGRIPLKGKSLQWGFIPVGLKHEPNQWKLTTRFLVKILHLACARLSGPVWHVHSIILNDSFSFTEESHKGQAMRIHKVENVDLTRRCRAVSLKLTLYVDTLAFKSWLEFRYVNEVIWRVPLDLRFDRHYLEQWMRLGPLPFGVFMW